MNKERFNLKIFSLQLFGYFFLLNGMKILFELKDIRVAEIISNGNSFEKITSEIQSLITDQPAGMVISDLVFYTTRLPYFALLFGFIIFWIFYSKRKSTLINFISSFLILIFFGGRLWFFTKYIFLKPFQLLEDYHLQIVLNGIFLILLSMLLFINSDSKKISNPNA